MAKEITNEQFFEFMTGMYNELNSKIDGMYGEMQEGFKKIKEDMATKRDLARLENKMDANHKALFDGYKQTYEKVTVIEKKVNEIDAKVDRHDVEIRVIKEAK